MTERPIIFDGESVRAILAARKTQTRRVITPDWQRCLDLDGDADDRAKALARCPYGDVGDRLWVREKWQHAPQQYCSCPQPSMAQPCDDWMHGLGCRSRRGKVIYAADNGSEYRWRSPVAMPRWASRIALEITDVRVQRLQEIGEGDARAEGVAPNWIGPLDAGPNGRGTQGWDAAEEGWKNYLASPDGEPCYTAKESFGSLWDSLNAKRGFPWASNPWVWAISFRRVVEANHGR